MVLDVQNERSVKLYPYTGMEVILHHPTEANHMSTGFIVTTGHKTYVEMTKKQVIREIFVFLKTFKIIS